MVSKFRLRRRAPILSDEYESVRQAVQDYTFQVETLEKLAGELRAAQSRRRELERESEYREAELRMDPSIDGRNAEIREAQLLALCREDNFFLSNTAELDGIKDTVQRVQDEATTCRDKMSLDKKIIDWATTYAKFLSMEEPNGF